MSTGCYKVYILDPFSLLPCGDIHIWAHFLRSGRRHFIILSLYAAMFIVLVVQQELVGKDTLLHLFQIMTDLFWKTLWASFSSSYVCVTILLVLLSIHNNLYFYFMKNLKTYTHVFFFILTHSLVNTLAPFFSIEKNLHTLLKLSPNWQYRSQTFNCDNVLPKLPNNWQCSPKASKKTKMTINFVQ